MNHLLKRGNRYYLNRKVPAELREYDPRKIVRIALKTDSKKEAIRLMVIQNDQLENYWRTLVRNGNKHEINMYEKAVNQARLLGFSYIQASQIAESPLPDIYARLCQAEKKLEDKGHVSAVLGGVDQPQIKLDELIPKYIAYSNGKTLNKSPNQIRKWLNPRKLAMKNLVECIGNKPLSQITRDDILKFRDWWISRIENGNAIVGTANKNLIIIKTVIETINENLNLRLDTVYLFKKITLPTEDEIRRLPFENGYIVSTLLNPRKLAGLNDQAKWVLHAIAETGAGISEQVGLLPEDIRLNCDIPHIVIQPRSKKALKTKYRKRIIPLVGFALDAFKACPDGFTDYRDRPDSLSGTLSKYLRENKLLLTDQHTVYSLRHSFQDRLLAVNAPDRVQADLMGHKFNRPAYGDGASLVQKLEWLQKIQLKPYGN